jgi:hypothetical protein
VLAACDGPLGGAPYVAGNGRTTANAVTAICTYDARALPMLWEYIIGVAFFVPFGAIPAAMFRLLRGFLRPWAIGALSGFAVCIYWVGTSAAGGTLVSEVISVFFLANVAAAGIAGGLAEAIVLPNTALPAWLDIGIVYVVLFAGYTTAGLITALVISTVLRFLDSQLVAPKSR